MGGLDDPHSLAEVLRSCERVTLENEFVPAEALFQALRISEREGSCLVPGADVLGTVQDKLYQRQALAKHRVPQPEFCALDSPAELDVLADRLGEAYVIKKRFGGYDGKGTAFVQGSEGLAEARALVGEWLSQGGVLAEALVPFQRELAVMVAVGPQGLATFPAVETLQTERVCDLVWTISPHPEAQRVASAAIEAVGLAGLAGVELFETPQGEVLVNEIAPRPHNTGHYTLDWGGPSQFEAHVRCVLGLPLPKLSGNEAAMANVLGREGAGDWRRAREAALHSDPEVFFHWYGKREARPGRKLGHINAVGSRAMERVAEARARAYAAWTA
ncbi:MAG: ATP-grasp domain-containing protein [Fimbriimonadaceae bacterium]